VAHTAYEVVRVNHAGTKAWAIIQSVRQRSNGACEYDVKVLSNCQELKAMKSWDLSPNDSNSFLTANIAGVWEWEDDSGASWVQYSRADTMHLESVFVTGTDTCKLTIRGRPYTAYLHWGVQYNDDTGFGRRIRRVSADFASPPKPKAETIGINDIVLIHDKGSPIDGEWAFVTKVIRRPDSSIEFYDVKILSNGNTAASVAPSLLAANDANSDLDTSVSGVWQWEDDGGGPWKLYDDTVSQFIEKAFIRGQDNVQVVIRGKQYAADLRRGVQFNNTTDYGRRIRRLRRDPVQAACSPPTTPTASLAAMPVISPGMPQSMISPGAAQTEFANHSIVRVNDGTVSASSAWAVVIWFDNISSYNVRFLHNGDVLRMVHRMSLSPSTIHKDLLPDVAGYWEWEDDDGKTWRRYSPTIGMTLERAFTAGKTTCDILIRSKAYRAYLRSGVQYNTKSQFGRRIRRVYTTKGGNMSAMAPPSSSVPTRLSQAQLAPLRFVKFEVVKFGADWAVVNSVRTLGNVTYYDLRKLINGKDISGIQSSSLQRNDANSQLDFSQPGTWEWENDDLASWRPYARDANAALESSFLSRKQTWKLMMRGKHYTAHLVTGVQYNDITRFGRRIRRRLTNTRRRT